MNTLRIGLVSISDRASSGVYQDKGIPALEEWLGSALTTPFDIQTRLIPDEQPIIEQTLCELVDEMSCHLVLTTGGTGPARRDVTPDATLAIADREMPGFGEQMRQISLHFVPTAILSRQVGVIRKQATYAAGPASLNGTVPAPVGTVLQHKDSRQYAVTASEAPSGGIVAVQLQAVEVGAAGNLAAGEPLTLVTPVPGLQSNGTSGDISGGADIEPIAMADINTAYERMLKGDVKYRFVIDSATLAG